MPYYLIPGILMTAAVLWDTVRELREKRSLAALCGMLVLPWLVFCAAALIKGGSAWNDAEHQFAAYQAGHYYLMSHGNYTEVSQAVFQSMRVLEIIGWGSFAAWIIAAIVLRARRKSAEQ